MYTQIYRNGIFVSDATLQSLYHEYQEAVTRKQMIDVHAQIEHVRKANRSKETKRAFFHIKNGNWPSIANLVNDMSDQKVSDFVWFSSSGKQVSLDSRLACPFFPPYLNDPEYVADASKWKPLSWAREDVKT